MWHFEFKEISKFSCTNFSVFNDRKPEMYYVGKGGGVTKKFSLEVWEVDYPLLCPQLILIKNTYIYRGEKTFIYSDMLATSNKKLKFRSLFAYLKKIIIKRRGICSLITYINCILKKKMLFLHWQKQLKKKKKFYCHFFVVV